MNITTERHKLQLRLMGSSFITYDGTRKEHLEITNESVQRSYVLNFVTSIQ